jgi:flagellar biosynthesis protein FlhF
MELKRILARDLRAATEKAVSLYGTDALVVSHEQVNGQTEVIVAVDLEPTFDREALELADNNASNIRGQDALNADGETASANDLSTINRGPEFEAIFSETIKPNTKKRSKRSDQTQLPEELRHDTHQSLVDSDDLAKTEGPANNPKREPMISHHHGENHREQLRAREIVDIVRQEMAVLRRELRLQQQLSSLSPVGLSSMGQVLNAALETLGVSTASRVLLIDEIQAEETVDAAIQKAETILAASLPKTITEAPTQGIHVICGPSGSGKTQAVTRLANKAAEAWGAEQIAVISYCDNRLGAWSQLQLGCSRSGLEAFRVTEPSLLPSLIEELKGRRAIFIDTAGPQLKSHCDEISKQVPKAQLHLALPTDISLAQALQLFKLCSWDDLIITKLDESAQCWGLVQALQQKPIALMNEASNGAGNLSWAAMSGECLAKLARTQLAVSVEDSLASETFCGSSGFSAEGLATLPSGFQPTQAVLAPKHSS